MATAVTKFRFHTVWSSSLLRLIVLSDYAITLIYWPAMHPFAPQSSQFTCGLGFLVAFPLAVYTARSTRSLLADDGSKLG